MKQTNTLVLRLSLLMAFIWLSTQVLIGQIGGRYVFDFISLPNSARATALGDYSIAVVDGDGFTAYQNPPC